MNTTTKLTTQKGRPSLTAQGRTKILWCEGFGLIEVMASVAIITTGLVASLTLLQMLTRATGESGARIVAQNLAREGIELVRHVRDTNWLETEYSALPPEEWDRGVDGMGPAASRDLTMLLDFAILNAPTSDLNHANYYNADDFTDSATTLWVGKRNTIVGGRYVHNISQAHLTGVSQGSGSPATAWEASTFKRLIKIYEICREIAPPNTIEVRRGEDQGGAGSKVCDQGPGWEKIGVEVTAEVQYEERGATHTVTLTDNLYNWK